MKKKWPDYLSYLLRLWRENNAGHHHRSEKQHVWRASLENSLTGKRQGFRSLDDLFMFLRRETGVEMDATEAGCDA